MPRLFVDCDDTLVLWGKEAGTATPWELNRELIFSIRCFLMAHEGWELIVWSGGGMDYARKWAERADFRIDFAITDKNMREPQPGDILVDDLYNELEPKNAPVTVVSPEAFVAACPLCRSPLAERTPRA